MSTAAVTSSSNHLNRIEHGMLKKISRTILGLIFSSCTLGICLWVIPSVHSFEITHSGLLKFSAVYSLAILLGSVLTFFSRSNGVAGPAFVLYILSFAMYIFSIICLYVCTVTVYFMVRESEKSVSKRQVYGNLPAFQACSILSLFSGLFSIYTTTQMPHMLRFLNEFKVLEKSRKIYLPKFIFPSPFVKKSKSSFRRQSETETTKLLIPGGSNVHIV